MRSVIANAVGLWRLLNVLVIPKLRIKQSIRGNTESESKYDRMLQQPTQDLLSSTPVFCPVCHRFVCSTAQSSEGIEITIAVNRRVTIGGNVIISADGKTHRGIPMRCPVGHEVWIDG